MERRASWPNLHPRLISHPTIIINAGVVDHDFEARIFLLFLRGSLLRCLDGEL
jgi:hypothetical protein